VQHEIQTLPFPTEKNSKQKREKTEDTGKTKTQNAPLILKHVVGTLDYLIFLTMLLALRLYSVRW
jgi:hypothetical protein